MINNYYNVYLNEIFNACSSILKNIVGKSYRNFIADNLLYNSVIYNLEEIASAADKIPNEEKQKSEDIDWNIINKIRDIISIKPRKLNNEYIWEITETKIPKLHKDIAKIFYQDKTTEGK